MLCLSRLRAVLLLPNACWMSDDSGLPNFGHTCYVNAAVQAIAPLLRTFLAPESVAGVSKKSHTTTAAHPRP